MLGHFSQFKGVNKGIRETIRVSPEKFIAFNNGITITSIAKELDMINGKIFIKSLTGFQSLMEDRQQQVFILHKKMDIQLTR